MFNKYINYLILLGLIVWITNYKINVNLNINEKFTNKSDKLVVLITGSSQGIGQMIGDNLDPEKYLVIKQGTIFVNKDSSVLKHGTSKPTSLNGSSKQTSNNDNHYIQANFSNDQEINNFVDTIKNKYGQIDIFINSFWDSSSHILDYQINTNYVNTIKLFEKIIPLIKPNGKIINLSTDNRLYSDNKIVDTYMLIKSNLNSYIKLKSKEYYKKAIGFTSLKIDKPYGTKLNGYNKNLEQNLKEILPGINFILDNDWNTVTGREFYSSNIKDQRIGYYLEMHWPFLDDYTIMDEIKSNLNNGENFMKPNIKEKELCRYNNNSGELIKKIAQIHGVKQCDIFLFHGLFETLDRAINIFVPPHHNVVGCGLNWISKIKTSAELVDVEYLIKDNYQIPNYPGILDKIDSFTRLIYLIAPLDKNDFDNFIKQVPFNIPIVIDFCYDDFVISDKKIKMRDYLKSPKSIICLNTFSKFYSLPGIHLGYSVAKNELNKIIGNYIKYPINTFYEKIALGVLNDIDYQNKIRKYFSKEMKRITKILSDAKINYLIENPIVITIMKKPNSKYSNSKSIWQELKKYNLDYFVQINEFNSLIQFKIILNKKEINSQVLDIVNKVFGTS